MRFRKRFASLHIQEVQQGSLRAANVGVVGVDGEKGKFQVCRWLDLS